MSAMMSSIAGVIRRSHLMAVFGIFISAQILTFSGFLGLETATIGDSHGVGPSTCSMTPLFSGLCKIHMTIYLVIS